MTGSAFFMTANTIISIALFALSLIAPLIHILFLDRTQRYVQNIQEMMLKYGLFLNIGCLFIVGFVGQFVYGSDIALGISWQWSPFQYELAFSELCLGVLGLACALFNYEFWLATIIGSSIWLLGASGVHLYYLITTAEYMLKGSLFVICWNIFIALWSIILYIMFYKSTNRTLKDWLRGVKSP